MRIHTELRDQVRRLRDQGLTLAAIAERLDITYQRVQQILANPNPKSHRGPGLNNLPMYQLVIDRASGKIVESRGFTFGSGEPRPVRASDKEATAGNNPA